MNKVTDTHSEYVIFNAFKRQQCQHERTSILPYMYTASLAIPKFTRSFTRHKQMLVKLQHFMVH